MSQHYGREYRSSRRDRARHWGREGASRPRSGSQPSRWSRWQGEPPRYAVEYEFGGRAPIQPREPQERAGGGASPLSGGPPRTGGRRGYMTTARRESRTGMGPYQDRPEYGGHAGPDRYRMPRMRPGRGDFEARDRHMGASEVGYAAEYFPGSISRGSRGWRFEEEGGYGRAYGGGPGGPGGPRGYAGDYVRELPGRDQVHYGHTPPDRWPDVGHELADARTQRWTDDDICDAVCENLFQDSWVNPEQIEVAVENGVVTLRGEVADFMEARYVWDDAWEAPGVRGVVNHLTVRTDVPSTDTTLPQTSGRGQP